jgi:hypothetical protein
MKLRVSVLVIVAIYSYVNVSRYMMYNCCQFKSARNISVANVLDFIALRGVVLH